MEDFIKLNDLVTWNFIFLVSDNKQLYNEKSKCYNTSL